MAKRGKNVKLNKHVLYTCRPDQVYLWENTGRNQYPGLFTEKGEKLKDAKSKKSLHLAS